MHDHILHSFGGRLIGNKLVKERVVEAVIKLPEELIEYITKNVWFLSSSPDAWAYTFHGKDVPDKYLIILSDELFSQPEYQIQYTILHEIGHVILKHRNSIGYKQTKQEVNQQEIEADSFARRYLDELEE
jgi:Zn-dependent peptidase ImmA (M78 family)